VCTGHLSQSPLRIGRPLSFKRLDVRECSNSFPARVPGIYREDKKRRDGAPPHSCLPPGNLQTRFKPRRRPPSPRPPQLQPRPRYLRFLLPRRQLLPAREAPAEVGWPGGGLARGHVELNGLSTGGETSVAPRGAQEGVRYPQRLEGSPSLLPPSQLASRLVWQLDWRRRLPLLQMPPSKEMPPP